MILLYGKNPVGNVIHAMVGPESELWMDMHGSLTVDITALLQACSDGIPVLLNLTRCGAEAKLSAGLQEAMKFGKYPFLPGTSVFVSTEPGSVAASGPANAGHEPARPARKQDEAPAEGGRSVVIQRGTCGRCNDHKAELVPGMSPPICFSCAKIDLYQARKEKPNIGDGVPPEFQ